MEHVGALNPREQLAIGFRLILSPAIDVRAPYAVQMLEALVDHAQSTGPYPVGTRVRKVRGDYEWEGDVRCCYAKRNGVWRIVSENDQRLNHIFGPSDLEAI